MIEGDILERIRRLAKAYHFDYTRHARLRMLERGVTEFDVRRALSNASSATAAEEGKWRTVGPDSDGDDLTVIIAFDGVMLVVTVF